MTDPFRLVFPIADPGFSLHFNDRVFAVGSCFVQHIAGYLQRLKMRVMINPNGVQYNPVSTGNTIRHVLEQKPFTEDDLILSNGYYHSIYHDTSFRHDSMQDLLRSINKNRDDCDANLRNAHLLIITLGTAWVWRSKNDGRIVSNCHKVPQSEFTHELLGVEQTEQHLSETISLVRRHTAIEHICFTISPVRYWRSDPVKDRLGKSVLHLAAARLIEQHQGLSYFCGYEILEDELRDYRFYAEDMCHPSGQTIQYVLKRFLDAYCSPDCLEALEVLAAIERRINHRPLHPDSKDHVEFVQKTAVLLDDAEKRFGVDLSNWRKKSGTSTD